MSVANESRTDLDSHADQCAVGRNSLLVHDYDRPINVSGFHPSGPINNNLRQVSAALAYDDPFTGETTILLVHQAIYVPELEYNLLSTMQVRLNDVTISEVPRFLAENVSDLTHSIAIPTANPDKPYIIPLSLHGVTSFFPTRKPTPEEYESLPHLTLTSDEPEYDPHDTSYASQEAALTKILATGDRIGAPPPSRRLCSVTKTFSNARALITMNDPASVSLKATSLTFDDGLFANELNRKLSAISRRATGNQFDPEMLARNWGIDRVTARRMINTTTQRGIRTLLHPTLSRRFRTNDRQLRYRRLPIECFTDTLISKTASRRLNMYAQIFATSDGWCRAYPMRLKSEAHEGLSLLFQREGVPNVMIMDGALEQVRGTFRKKCREAGVHVKQTEPHTPWSNAAEAAIRELKKGVGRQMVR